MSAFCVKTPLRKAIIVEDYYWDTAKQLTERFNNKKKEDRYIYRELTKETIGEESAHREELKLPGCRRQHVIIFMPTGEIKRKEDICDCDECVVGCIDSCMYDSNNAAEASECEAEGEELEDDGDDDDFDEQLNERIEMILQVVKSGDVIALHTPGTEKESFYLCIIHKTDTAEENIFDAYNHHILKGMRYISCFYLTRSDEKSREERRGKFTQYRKLSQLVYVLPGEVLCPFVNISSDLKLCDTEKQWLDDMA